jgi:DNA replication protein DnaC
MENQNHSLGHQQEIDKIEIQIIGIRKYEYLKSLRPEDRTELSNKQIEAYESKHRFATPEQIKKTTDYLQGLLDPKPNKEFSITARDLWNLFKANFQEVNQRPFVKIDGITVKNMEPLIYYFSKDERFFDCDNLSNLSVPSFEKGILIIGNFGNGKTSTMKVFEKIFKGIPGIGFKGYSANETVTLFEKCSTDILRDEFEKMMFNGNRYFDDLKTERIASNFGKVNIFKEILEERYNRKSKTFVTCNFDEAYPDNMEAALDQFSKKYGERVYDRLFEMFNIVEFKGKSFRK